jgi:hypothetical protein
MGTKDPQVVEWITEAKRAETREKRLVTGDRMDRRREIAELEIPELLGHGPTHTRHRVRDAD